MVYNTINIIRIMRAFKQTNTNKEKKTTKTSTILMTFKEKNGCLVMRTGTLRNIMVDCRMFEEHNGRLSNV